MQNGSVRARHAAQMRRVVGGFARSGLTKVAYCRTQGISLWQFRNWSKRTAPASPFVEVKFERDGVGADAGEIELRLPGGVVAVVRAGTKTSLIRRVLKAAASC